MSSTYSSLKIELIGTGEQSGTWGVTTNNNLQYAIEEAITGSTTVTFSNTDVQLSLSNTNLPQTARNLRLVLDGVASTPLNLIVPSIEKFYIIENQLANNITVKTLTGTGVVVAPSTSTVVYNDSINVYDGINYLNTLTLGASLAVTSGGTGVTTSTGSGSNVLNTSPTLITPDIGTPSAGILTNCTGLPVSGITGTLPINKGGTNSTATPSQGAVAYGNGTSIVYTAVGTTGQVLQSNGSGAPTWGNAFVTGMIMMWSGTIATIPTGWLLCNGLNGTPDLRNQFVIGAFSDTAGVAYTTITGANTKSGGSKDLVVPSHTHTITDSGHAHGLYAAQGDAIGGAGASIAYRGGPPGANTSTATTGISVNTAGVSATNQNLPPYYALAFIMKS